MKKRTKFIGLELLLMSTFLIGYCVIDAIFLADYESVGTILSTDVYTLYMMGMLVLIAILALVPFLAGMYFQLYLTEKVARKAIKKLVDDNPELLTTEGLFDAISKRDDK